MPSTQHSIVRRVDNALGLLLELRSEEDAPVEQGPAEAEADGQTGGKGKNKKKKGGDKKAGPAQAQPSAAAGYAHISAVSESRIEKLDKVCMRPSPLATLPKTIQEGICGESLHEHICNGAK